MISEAQEFSDVYPIVSRGLNRYKRGFYRPRCDESIALSRLCCVGAIFVTGGSIRTPNKQGNRDKIIALACPW